MMITALSVTFFLVAGATHDHSPARSWRLEPRMSGEGIPVFAAVLDAANGKGSLWVDFPSDGLCSPDLNLKVVGHGIKRDSRRGPLYEAAQLSGGKGRHTLKAHGANQNILQLHPRDIRQRYEIVAWLGQQSEFEASVGDGSQAVRFLFRVSEGKGAIAQASARCDEALLAEQSQIFPASHGQPVPQEEAFLYSERVLRIARNEIFARHGHVFRDPALGKHFASKAWYTPKPGQAVRLSRVEQANVALLKKLEEKRQRLEGVR